MSESLGYAGIVLNLIGLTLLCFVRFRNRATRSRCPGPRRRRVSWLWPLRWYFRRVCGYELAAQSQSDIGFVRCPECGRRSRPAEWVGVQRRWRPLSFAASAFFAAFVCFTLPALRGGILAALPTPLLITGEWLLHAAQPKLCQDELEDRIYNGQVTGGVAEWCSQVLTRDLYDDDIKWNADRAEGLLDQLWPASEAALEETLEVGDRQARLIAAAILRRRTFWEPSDALLRASIEDLQDDTTAVDFRTYYNAFDAANFLCRHPDRIEPLIADALQSDDLQQRLAAAAIAGNAGYYRLAADAAPLLTRQLASDEIEGNAALAMNGLIRFGEYALPFLEPLFESKDEQARASALFIRERILNPDVPPKRLAHPPPRITIRVHDPSVLSVADGVHRLRLP